MSDSSDGVFLLNGEELRPLPMRAFRAGLFGRTLEAALQTLIERHPEVVPGRQMDPAGADPPRFALLRREMLVEGGSLDLLLVDQHGVLTLVETKLIENSEARREVIGQIIEYAANAQAAWGGGRARSAADEYWRQKGCDLGEVLRARLGEDLDVEAFWVNVEKQLKEGHIRLVVAGDRLSAGVRRVVEYLNGEMETVEVFGLELEVYGQHEGEVVLVPRLIGQTQVAAERKGPGGASSPTWTPEGLRAAFTDLADALVSERLRVVLDWATRTGSFLEAKAKNPVFGLRGQGGDRIFTFYPDGTVYWFLNAKHYRGGEGERDALWNRLRDLSMVDGTLDRQSVSAGRNLPRGLKDLTSSAFDAFLEVLGDVCGRGETP